MAFKTLDEIQTKIERDVDIEEEEFVQPDEIVAYINDAISEAEAHIIKLGGRDKYFLTRTKFQTVLGTEDYDLPTTIYGNKIIRVVYKLGTRIYDLNPIDSSQMFEDIQYSNDYETSNPYYRYLIRHDTPGTEKFQLVPAARETTSGDDGITIWFYRAANKLTDPTDICDLPEIAVQYVYQHVKKAIYEKEKGPEWQLAKGELDQITDLMIATLTQQIADEKMSEIEKDLSCYREHS